MTPLLSMVFEKNIYDQLYVYLENFLSGVWFPKSPFQGTCSLQANSEMACRTWLGYVGTVLMDLSKAYDCLSHDLLLPKLQAYGLDMGSLNILLDYLTLRSIKLK